MAFEEVVEHEGADGGRLVGVGGAVLAGFEGYKQFEGADLGPEI